MIYRLVQIFPILSTIVRALDAKSLNNFMFSCSLIKNNILKIPNINKKLKYYKHKRESLDYELLDWLYKHMPNLQKLVVGTIKLNDPWKELTKFKSLEAIGFTLTKYDYFPRQKTKMNRLEILDHSLNTKSYLDTLFNFQNLTEVKLSYAKITSELLTVLNFKPIEKLHLQDCLEKFEIRENAHIYFRNLKKLTILQLNFIKPSKLFLLYSQNQWQHTRKLTINISYAGEDTAYLPIYNPQRLAVLNIYVNHRVIEFSQQFVRFIMSLDPQIKVKAKTFKDSPKITSVNLLVEKVNDIRKLIELTN